MSIKHHALIYLAFAALVTGVLACGLPQGTPPAPQPTVTPYVPVDPTQQISTPTLPTEVPPVPTDTPLPTDTPPPTNAPPPTPVPTQPPTQPPTGKPLEIVDQGYEIVDWQPLPNSSEWEGHLRIVFTGGVPPHTSSIGHRDPQSENHHYFRYAACKGAAVRTDVWSADGQHAHRDVWVPAPWCPTATPNP